MSDDMHDDLNDLKSAFKAATPAPDAAKRAANIALAKKNLANLQGSRDQVRPTSERPNKGFFRGVRTMIANLSTRGALTATTAFVAFGLVIALPQLTEQTSPIAGGLTLPEAEPTSIIAETQGGDETEFDQGALTRSSDGRYDFDLHGYSGDTVASAPADRLAQESAQADSAMPQSATLGVAPEDVDSPAPSAEAETAIGGLVNAKPVARKQASNAAEGIVTLQSMPADDAIIHPETNTEVFPDADPNPLKITAEDPVSTFSIDVDTASYAILRSTISNGRLPQPDAVRIEEMINYFPYDYPAPKTGEHPFKPTVSVVPTPWNAGTQLVHIAIQGEKPAVENRPPLNLVFLIDTSGSMNQPSKLPLLKQSLSLMLSQLSAQDQVAIVTYAGSAGQVLAPTPATQRSTIMSALENLSAGGSTAGQAGLQQAYSVANGMAEEGEVTRVILATDGDFNVGLSDPDALKDYIADKRESGTYLSVMGFGRGNLDDATMQALAQNGNGQAAYIDTLSEAQKVLVDQFSGALFPIADDVKIQVEFNPYQISEYRLIGYETRALKREDFNNDKVDAGDIGAGTAVTAIYEVTPVGSDAQLTDPLRYGEVSDRAKSTTNELGYLKLRYKAPGESESTLIETPILPDTSAIEGDTGFAIAIAGFGEVLKGSAFAGDWSFNDAVALANATKGVDAYGYRAEAIRLMRLASSLSEQ